MQPVLLSTAILSRVCLCYPTQAVPPMLVCSTLTPLVIYRLWLFRPVCVYRGIFFLSYLGSNTSNWVTLGALFTLFGILTPYVWMFLSATTTLELHPPGALTFSHHAPLSHSDALSNLREQRHPVFSCPQYEYLFPWLQLCHFSVGRCSLPFPSGVDDSLPLLFLTALETESFRKKREIKRKEKRKRVGEEGQESNLMLLFLSVVMMMMVKDCLQVSKTTPLCWKKTGLGALNSS